ncbi:MAG: Cof-type HAD-IIB family hydrolase [Eubacteriales bacterium]|nr:Cof-type HAD-IIB family hydrolase [Eubacteriales bacterium]
MHKNGMAFFDLDGTLLDNSIDQIPSSAIEAIEKLRSNYYVVISTGRDMDSHYSVKYKDIINPDAIIHLNGCKITVGDELVFEHYMDESLLKDIYKYAQETGDCFGATIGNEDFYINPQKKMEADAAYNPSLKRNFVDFEEIFNRKIRIHALSYAGDLTKDKERIEGRFKSLILKGFQSEKGADVVERGFSKADGMQKLMAYFDMKDKKTYAFGDSSNDIEIIKAATVGVAMGNACEELKKNAGLVTDNIDRDGISKALYKLNLI